MNPICVSTFVCFVIAGLCILSLAHLEGWLRLPKRKPLSSKRALRSFDAEFSYFFDSREVYEKRTVK